MTEARPACSHPLRALVILLFLWSGGRATYEFATLFGADWRPSTAAANKVAAVGQAARPNPLFVFSAPLTTFSRSISVIRPRRIDIARTPSSEANQVPLWPAPKPATATAPILSASAATRAVPVETRVDERAGRGMPDRLSLSSWLIVRDGSTGLVPSGTLGGAQVGLRTYLPLSRGLSVTARISAPLYVPGTETSVGVALRQGPVMLLLERRIALERGGRNDFSATIAAGVGGVRLPHRFRLDAYGQTGLVGRDGFADGAVRIERRIATHGKTDIAVGAGAWGGAQPGIARLDVGPQIVARIPIADGTLRASGEWRQRIAGNAAPLSGPSLSLGMDL